MKAGTVHMTLRLSLDALSGMDLNSTFYLLKNDGTRFIMYGVVPVIENGTALFDVPLYYEANSPSTSGTFTLAGPRRACLDVYAYAHACTGYAHPEIRQQRQHSPADRSAGDWCDLHQPGQEAITK